jgi:hypothetical protein
MSAQDCFSFCAWFAINDLRLSDLTVLHCLLGKQEIEPKDTPWQRQADSHSASQEIARLYVNKRLITVFTRTHEHSLP